MYSQGGGMGGMPGGMVSSTHPFVLESRPLAYVGMGGVEEYPLRLLALHLLHVSTLSSQPGGMPGADAGGAPGG
eukprot:CAMPEP_0174713942 /NCGR_PEP_ID=MMETSP1094-20130205/15776_1 /TAXON_ID=156173 /ORGANISM="Chrysochromulina brevifilum, Strain UTEX LB 985" /LENGTH=73 /DNA_ID=CAMNT_0015913183 /DNA_START=1 /DNA_END=219 /DNA_ORIENTATION=-